MVSKNLTSWPPIILLNLQCSKNLSLMVSYGQCFFWGCVFVSVETGGGGVVLLLSVSPDLRSIHCVQSGMWPILEVLSQREIAPHSLGRGNLLCTGFLCLPEDEEHGSQYPRPSMPASNKEKHEKQKRKMRTHSKAGEEIGWVGVGETSGKEWA